MSVPAINAIVKPFSELVPRKQRFIKAYVRSGDLTASYLEAGYKDAGNLKAKAGKLLRECAPYLQEQTDAYVSSVDLVILGTKVLKDLATDEDLQGMVRLNAAKELRSRGIKEVLPEQVIHHKHEGLSDKSLDDRILELQKKLGFDE